MWQILYPPANGARLGKYKDRVMNSLTPYTDGCVFFSPVKILSVCLSAVLKLLLFLSKFFELNIYPVAHHSQGGMKFATQISPLLNL